MPTLKLSLAGTFVLTLLGGLGGAVVAQDAEAPGAPEPGAASQATWEPADSGARIIEIEPLDERMLDLIIHSPAVGVQKARLLLPAGFDPEADDAWPVLHLLQGCCGDYTMWTRETDVEELAAELDLLVVTRDAGEWGWYRDWHDCLAPWRRRPGFTRDPWRSVQMPSESVDARRRIDPAGGDDARPVDHGRLDRVEPLANPARAGRERAR